MRFVQFYTLSTGYVPGSIPPAFNPDLVAPIEAVGSDGVLPVDGRLGKDNIRFAAQENCVTRGFVGYSIREGQSYSDSREVQAFRSRKDWQGYPQLDLVAVSRGDAKALADLLKAFRHCLASSKLFREVYGWTPEFLVDRLALAKAAPVVA